MLHEELTNEILEYIEKIDENNIDQQRFNSFISRNEIYSYLAKSTNITKEDLDYWLLFMVNEGLLIKVIDDTGKEVYKSAVGELVCLLNNLKLLTREKEYDDVSLVKFSRNVKESPRRDKSIGSLNPFLINAFDEYRELRSLGSKIRYVVECVTSTLSTSFSNISEFQLDAAKKLVNQGLQKYPSGAVLTADTGGGKTLGFILAPLIYAHLANLAGIKGTKVMLVYPRNALADDQCRRLKKLSGMTSDSLSNLFEEEYRKQIGGDYAKLVKINVDGDFGGKIDIYKRSEFYQNPPEILVTNADTLHRRLLDPSTSRSFKNLKFVVFDEIHLYHGHYGTNAIFLIRRLKKRINYFGGNSVLIGSSATISQPEDFCSKLFSTEPPNKPALIGPDPAKFMPYGVEYHVFLKPFITRSGLSVMEDATSCLIHNRRKEGLAKEQSKKDVDDVHKSIGFADSRDLIVRWSHHVGDFEHSARKGYKRRRQSSYQYLNYIAPCCDTHSKKKVILENCRQKGIPLKCNYFRNGKCWVLSRDGGKNSWKKIKGLFDRIDNIWAFYKSSTAGKESLGELFVVSNYEPIKYYSLVVATSSLEVGIDIPNVSEILLYKAIRSPGSYKQRVGRGGRELGSKVFALSILANTPRENYFLRHYMSLVVPTYYPVPLEKWNLDIAKIHATSAIVDYVASQTNNRNLPNIYELKKSIENGLITSDSIEKIKKEISNERCIDYLRDIVDEDIARESVDNFLKFLENLARTVYKVGIEDLSLADFIKRYGYDKEFKRDINSRLVATENLKESLENIRTKIRKKLTEGTEYISFLDKDSQAKMERLFEEIREVIQ